MDCGADAGNRPTVMVTNDDGIDAPGLRALVRVLVSANRYEVLVCAPDSEKSAVSHSITWRNAVSVKEVEIDGATAFAVSANPSGFVISGINMGSNCGYHIVYSGTVAGAREAFFNGVPSLSISYDWIGSTSCIHDYVLAAEACLPIINAMLSEIKNKTYPQKCFLNVDLPTNVAKHKGYKLTKQGTSIVKMGWRQVTSEAQGGKMLSTMSMETTSSTNSETEDSVMSQERRLFKREVKEAIVDNNDTDCRSLQEGYITVTPLGALSHAEIDCQAYFQEWLPGVAERFSTSAL
ncbi:unnamed protein product [Camellia sinensis]